MSTRRLLFTSSLYNALGHLTLLIASFFSLPILVQSLGTSLFGRYLLIVGIPALAGLADLGFGNGSLYFLSRDPSPLTWRKILGGNLLATIPMVLTAALVAYLGVGHNLFLLIAVLVCLNQLSDVILILAQSKNNYAIFNLKVIVVGLGNTLGSALIARATHSLEAVLLIQICFQTLIVFLVALWVKSQSYSLLPLWDRSLSLRTFRYGFSTLGSSLAGQLQAQTARYYLSYAMNTSATAIYGLAQSLVQKGLTLIQVTGRSFFATSASLHGAKKYETIQKLYLATIGVVLSLGLVAVVATHYLGLPIIGWWLHDRALAQEVYRVLVVLSYWFVAISLTPLTSYIGLGVGEGKLVSFVAISSAVVEIALLFVLTPRLGLVGPAYAALISSYIHTPLFLYLLWKKIRVQT